MRTMNVILKGWPAMVFLSVEKRYVEEASTRGFTVTPEITGDKLADANKLTHDKNAFPWTFEESEKTKKIKKVIAAIREWFETTKADVIIPFENLNELFPAEIVRDMRDFAHFSQFLKTVTAIHVFQRPRVRIKDKTYVMATLSDVWQAYRTYSEVFETTRTGTDKTLLDFFHNVMELRETWYLKTLADEYNVVSPRKVSSETMRRYLDRLEEIGYVDHQKDAEDKRLNLYYPLKVKSKLSTISHNNELCLVDLAKLQKGFETWLDRCTHAPVGYESTFFSAAPVDQPLTVEDVTHAILGEKNVLLAAQPCVDISIGKTATLTPEMEPETSHIEQLCPIVDNSDKLPANNPTSKGHIASHCFHFHKKSCTITKRDHDAKYDCISPENTCAQDCVDFLDSEKVAKGAADLLNGSSARGGSR